MSKFETVKITGKTMWAKVQEPTLKYRSKSVYQYEIELSLTDKQVKAIRKLDNLPSDKERKVRTHEGVEGNFMKFTRPVLSQEGKKMVPLKVVDEDGDATDVLIGNGSLVEVFFTLIPMEGGQTIVRPYKVKILELVEHSSSEPDDDDVQELGGGSSKPREATKELADDDEF